MAVLLKILTSMVLLLAVIQVIAAQFDGMKIECKLKDVTRTVSRTGCTPKQVVVSACEGTCRSLSAILMKDPWYETLCECCKRTGTNKKRVSLNCKGSSHTEEVLSASSCKCQRCRTI